MSIRAAERARLAAREAAQEQGEPWRYRPEPPGPPPCARCYAWRIDNADVGRYAWWVVCDHDVCDCACHDNEVILAS
jgi:hypothetical protein